MQASDTVVETAPLIDWFAPRVEGDGRVVASQIIGLSGIIGFAFLCCAGAGTIALIARNGDFEREFSSVVLTVLTSAIQWREVEPEAVLLFVPSALLMALVGMHCWTRLCALCPISAQAESGYGIWLAINLSIAFFVFVGFLSFNAQSKFAFLAFIIAPAAVLIAHIGTEIPIRWLRGCGWTFERFDDANRSP